MQVNLKQTLILKEAGVERRVGPGLVNVPDDWARKNGLRPEGNKQEAAPAASAVSAPEQPQPQLQLTGRHRVEHLGLSEGATDALKMAGIKTIAAFRSASDEELLEISGFGQQSLAKGREAAGG